MFYCLNSPSDDPRYNLATEEFLLRNKTDDFILFYANRPSVIVGKHQNIFREVNRAFLKEHPVPVIRRLSGGGTVWHDPGNLNFSFILNGEPGKLVDFGKYIKPVTDFINSLGIPAVTDTRNNILINGLKISGNAEHIFKNRVLHHGTLLFDTNLEHLEGSLQPNPEEITDKAVRSKPGRVTNLSRYLKEPLSFSLFRERLVTHCRDHFYPCRDYLPSPEEHARIELLVKEKYDTWEWNTAWSPACVLTRQMLLPRGTTAVRITVKNGRIEGFSFPEEVPEEVKTTAAHFTGLPYRHDAAKKMLETLQQEGKLSVISPQEWMNFLFD